MARKTFGALLVLLVFTASATAQKSKNGTRLLLENREATSNGFIPISVDLPIADTPASSQPAEPTSTPASVKPTLLPVVTSPSSLQDPPVTSFQNAKQPSPPAVSAQKPIETLVVPPAGAAAIPTPMMGAQPIPEPAPTTFSPLKQQGPPSQYSAPRPQGRAPAANYGSAPPGPVYGAPAKPDPVPAYGVPAKPAPIPAYGAPAKPAPVPSYGAPAKPAPVPSYGAPAKLAPVPSYGAPAKPDPVPAYGAPAPVYSQPPPLAYGAPAKEQKQPVYQKPKKVVKPVPSTYEAPTVSPTYMAAPILSSYAAPAPAYAPPPPPAYGALPPAPAYGALPPARVPPKPKPKPVENQPAVSYAYPQAENDDEGDGKEGIKSKLWGLMSKGLDWFKKDEVGVSDDDAVGYYKDGVWDLFVPLLVIGVVLPVVFGVAAAEGWSTVVPTWVRALANYLNNIFPIKVNTTGRALDTGLTSQTELNELERIFHKYTKAVYSEDCMAKISCELGDSFKDYPMKSWVVWLVEHFVPAKYSRPKVAFLKTANGDWTLESCSLYKCNTKKLKKY